MFSLLKRYCQSSFQHSTFALLLDELFFTSSCFSFSVKYLSAYLWKYQLVVYEEFDHSSVNMPTLLKRTFRHTWMRVCFFIIVLLTHHNDKHLTCAHDLEETICHPPCQNGGHCHIKHEVALCSCSKGFHGKLCERMTVYYEDFTVKPQGYIRGNWNTTVAGWDVYITTPMSSRATLGVIRHSDFGALEGNNGKLVMAAF